MTVTKLGERLGEGMAEVAKSVSELVARHDALSLVIAIEVAGERRPMVAIRGRYERDPYSALAALTRMKYLMQRRLDRLDFQEER